MVCNYVSLYCFIYVCSCSLCSIDISIDLISIDYETYHNSNIH